MNIMDCKNTLKYIFASFGLILIFNGCAKDENNIELVYGEWKVEDLRCTTTNGEKGPTSIKEYFIEFNSENCGRLLNTNKEETSTIKWGYQHAGDLDKFMISIQLENSLGSSNLAFNSLYEIRKLKEDKFLLTNETLRVSNDTTFVTTWDLNMTKQ